MARAFVRASNQYLSYESPITGSGPYTWAAWFYSTDDTVDQTIFANADVGTNNNYQAIFLINSGAQTVRHSRIGGGSGSANTTTTWQKNVWNHTCAVCYDDQNWAIFLNGGGKGTVTTASTNPAGLDNTTIGRLMRLSPANSMSGYIGRGGMWSAALTDAEVAILALGESPHRVRPASLVAWWELLRTDQDFVGGYHMTPYNSPTWADHPPNIKPYWFLPRTLGPPPAGGILVTPAPATAIGGLIDPSIVLGSMVVTPGLAGAAAQLLSPSVVLGSVTITPGLASAVAQALDPGVVHGSITITPAIAEALCAALSPSVVLGSTAATPAEAAAIGALLDPTVLVGGDIFVTPDAAQAIGTLLDPSVVISGGEVSVWLAMNLPWTLGAGGWRLKEA